MEIKPQNGGKIEASEYLVPTPGVNPFKYPESLKTINPFRETKTNNERNGSSGSFPKKR